MLFSTLSMSRDAYALNVYSPGVKKSSSSYVGARSALHMLQQSVFCELPKNARQ